MPIVPRPAHRRRPPADHSGRSRPRHRRLIARLSTRTRAIVAAGAAAAVVGGMTLVAPSALAADRICEQYGATRVDGGRYIVQNNRWGATTAQCIDVDGPAFTVTSAAHANATNGAPAAYPSVFAGCHYGNCTSASGLPRRADALSGATVDFATTTPPDGQWNASLDLWFDPTRRTNGQNTGAELMVWTAKRGAVQPIGSRVATVQLAGATWEVWTGRADWNVISYVRTAGPSDLNDASLAAFVTDAIARGSIRPEWFLTSVQGGFEPWVGGAGLRVDGFGFEATGRKAAPAPATPPRAAAPEAGNGEKAGPARQVAYPGGERLLVGAASGRCVDVEGKANRNGAPTILWNCHRESNQRFTAAPDGTVRVYGRCLEVAYGPYTTAANTQVQIWDCYDGPNQQWRLRSDGSLFNPASGRCLDAPGVRLRTPLVIRDCTGAADQRWSTRSPR